MDRVLLCRAVMRLAALLLLAILTGCGVPRDPEKTLPSILERGEIRVGVAEAPPFIVRTGLGRHTEPAGVDADLIRELAKARGLKVRWYWGSLDEHFGALEAFQLDLVAGGITSDTTWKKRVGLTQPYLKADLTVGFPPGARLRDDLTGVRVAVQPASPLAALLEEEEAVPVAAEKPFDTNLPVVAPAWELRAHGYAMREERLKESRHVMAVPPGENGWLLVVDGHLLSRRQSVEGSLVRGVEK